MSSIPALPEHEAFISSYECSGPDLHIRLVTDYHPGADPQAYDIVAKVVVDPYGATTFLQRCKTEQQYLYVFLRDDCLCFETEDGEHLDISAKEVIANPSTFNENELSELAQRVYGWYLSENEALGKLNSRLQTARQILFEASRRIEIKAAAHDPNGTAGKLYSKQLALIQRVFDALET